MLKGFRDFILRGNVLDLAVAVVMGTAFTTIVTSITTSLIKPLINAIGGSAVKGLGVDVISGNASTYIDLAAILNAAINFLIIAIVVYFALVLPVKKIHERRNRGQEASPAGPTEVELLTEIRDLLAMRRPMDQ